MLTTTARRSVTTDGTNPAGILGIGSGLLDMSAAAAAGASFTPSALNFGARLYSDTVSITGSLVIANLTSTPDRYDVSVTAITPGALLTLSSSNTGLVASRGTAAST